MGSVMKNAPSNKSRLFGSVCYCLAVIGVAIHGWHPTTMHSVLASASVSVEAKNSPLESSIGEVIDDAPSFASVPETSLPKVTPYPVISSNPVKSAPATPVLDGLTGVPLTHQGPLVGEQAKVLMYHYIRSGVDPVKDPLGVRLSVSPTLFDSQMAALKKGGYTVVTMKDLLAHGGGPKTVVLTFDDGYEDFYTSAYPILQKYGFTATIYIISGKIGGPYMTWPQLQQLEAASIEIGAHTVNHKDLSRLSADEQRQEIIGSKIALEQRLGTAIVSFCYPSGRYSADTVKIAREAGFGSATTTQPGIMVKGTDHFLIPRIRMTESVTSEVLLKALSR